MESQVRVVFFGQVLDGFHVDDVKRSFREMFRLDEAKVERLFSGARTVIKNSLHAEEAARYVRSMEKLGARVRIEPVQASASPAAPAITPPPPPPPAAPPAAPAALALTPIEEKLRAETREREERAAAAYVPPRALLADPVVVYDAPGLFGFGFSGRIARLPYAAAGLLAWSAIAWLAMGAALWTLALLVPVLIGFVVLTVWTTRLTVLRLHDMNLSGWWVLALFIPYAGAVLSLGLMVVPGTRGQNDHGDPPHPASALLVLLTILALCVTAATAARVVSKASRKASLQQPVSDKAAAPSEAEIAAHLHSAAAAQGFREEYWPAAAQKAFAVSKGGAWGWHAGATTMQDAAAQAMAQCDKQRQPYTGSCELVNVNGFWLDMTAPGR